MALLRNRKSDLEDKCQYCGIQIFVPAAEWKRSETKRFFCCRNHSGLKKRFLIKKNCIKCNKEFEVETTETYFDKIKDSCSLKCANKRKQTEETKQKIRDNFALKRKELLLHRHLDKCLNCDNLVKRKHKKCCSRECSSAYTKKVYALTRDKHRQYALDASFQFNLADYSNEFDFSLVESHGWYSCKKNTNGVSRDHIVSVNFGYKNNIDPKIIAHPANCKLLRQNDNASKHKKCGMTYDELLQKNKEWDLKYTTI